MLSRCIRNQYTKGTLLGLFLLLIVFPVPASAAYGAQTVYDIVVTLGGYLVGLTALLLDFGFSNSILAFV